MINKMKRFLLFAGDSYYPIGGWRDIKGSADTIEEAQKLNNNYYDWWHIVDSVSGDIVARR